MFSYFYDQITKSSSQNIQLTTNQLTPIPTIAIAAYFTPESHFLYCVSSPAAVTIRNP